eukprot:gene18972-906_t
MRFDATVTTLVSERITAQSRTERVTAQKNVRYCRYG